MRRFALQMITASEYAAGHHRISYSLPLALALALTVNWPSLAAEWHPALCLDGGGWWRSRIGVRAHNETNVAVAGEPATIAIGSGPGQAQLAGQVAQSLRVCDAAGREMLFALHGPTGTALTAGPIPEGSTLVIPIECPPQGTAAYFDNPSALAVPDFLEARVGALNGSVEQGHGEAPDGWTHDPAAAAHRASWSLENPRSGKRCLKTVVAAGSEPS